MRRSWRGDEESPKGSKGITLEEPWELVMSGEIDQPRKSEEKAWSVLRVARAKDHNKANGLRLVAGLLMANLSSCQADACRDSSPGMGRACMAQAWPVPADLKQSRHKLTWPYSIRPTQLGSHLPPTAPIRRVLALNGCHFSRLPISCSFGCPLPCLLLSDSHTLPLLLTSLA